MVRKKQADEAYEKGQPLMTDEEYDITFGKNATAEYLNDGSGWNKMPHPDRFGGSSLDKISVIENGGFNFTDLYVWSSTHIPPYCCSYKYDGISVNLIYEDGVLVHAITKGAGNLGEDILKNVEKMRNVKLFIPGNYNCAIKAEIIIDHRTFDLKLKDNYSNPRNGAAGAARAYDGANAHYCSLKYYGVVPLDGHVFELETEKFKVLEDLDIDDVVWRLCWNVEEVIDFYKKTLERRPNLGYEIDGIVVTTQMVRRQFKNLDDERPRYSVALKLPYSEKKSVVRKIIWQNGMKGRITPVAIIDPIELGGATVSRVTLKNLDEMKRLCIHINDEILVSRRGDVIPNIESNLTQHDELYKLQVPATCPACGGMVSPELPYLFCRNIGCSSKALGDIKTWVNTIKDHFNYRGFAEKRIEQLYDEGLVITPADLYTLMQDKLESLPGIGVAVATDILDFGEYTEIPFSVFLTGLNIEGINHKMAKLVSEKYETFDALVEVWSGGHPVFSLQSIPGFGEFRALSLIQGLDTKQEVWNSLLEWVKVVPDKKPVGDKLKGKKFCITGKLSQTREYFANLILENGGGISSGVTNATDYLVAGEKTGASKTNAARECGTKVITEQELKEML